MAGEPQRFPPVNKSHDLDERVARFLRVMDENKEGGFSSQVARATLDAINRTNRDPSNICTRCKGYGLVPDYISTGRGVAQVCHKCNGTGKTYQ